LSGGFSPIAGGSTSPPGNNAAGGLGSGSNTGTGNQNQQRSTLLAPPVTILTPKISSTNSLPASSTENNNNPSPIGNNNPSPPVTILAPRPGPEDQLPRFNPSRTHYPLFNSPTEAGGFGARVGAPLGLLPAALYIAHTPVTEITVMEMVGGEMVPITYITFGAGATYAGAALAIAGGVIGGALVGAVIVYGLYKLSR